MRSLPNSVIDSGLDSRSLSCYTVDAEKKNSFFFDLVLTKGFFSAIMVFINFAGNVFMNTLQHRKGSD